MLLNSAISFSLESAFASRRGTVCKNEKANAAGNLTFAGTNRPRRGRNLTWTEDNRLIKVTEDVAPKYHSFYRYDAGGERTYKLVYNDVSSSYRPRYDFVGATMYPNPFLVITPEGYTKHYYAGTERIAAQIGKGKFNNINTSIANADSTAAKLTAVNSIAPYLANYATPQFTYLNILPILSTTEKEIYYYHTDHLGSSAWITDSLGVAVQHLAYLPWGEPYVTQKTGNFNPMFTFSGKEKDAETGYSYFGQRFYDSQLSLWLSVDPMRGKYPSLSPFVYCANNPIILKDPDGNAVVPTNKLKSNPSVREFFSYVENNSVFRGVMGRFYSNQKTVYIHLTQLLRDDGSPSGRGNIARTEYSWNDDNPVGKYGMERIILNSDILDKSGNISGDRTFVFNALLHEAIHAKRGDVQQYDLYFSSYPGYKDFIINRSAEGGHHNQMAIFNRQVLIDGMKEFDSQMGTSHSEEWYEAVSWSGLDETSAWRKFKAANPEKARIYQNIWNQELKKMGDY